MREQEIESILGSYAGTIVIIVGPCDYNLLEHLAHTFKKQYGESQTKINLFFCTF
jgi:hypothetical protein